MKGHVSDARFRDALLSNVGVGVDETAIWHGLVSNREDTSVRELLRQGRAVTEGGQRHMFSDNAIHRGAGVVREQWTVSQYV